MVQLSESLVSSIEYSYELAITNCRREFQWEKWNCPQTEFLSKSTSEDYDRETAYVKAISAAAFIYTFTRNCSRGELNGCGCDLKRIKNRDDRNWKWAGCSDHVSYGEEIANQVLDKQFSPGVDAQGYANMHNHRAGRIVSLNARK